MTELLLYGGLAGMGVSLLLLIILVPVFRHQRKKMIERIENGDDE